VEHKEEWVEWFLFKVCVEEQKFETLFRALRSTDDVECSDSGEYNARHAFVLGTLSKYLANHPKEVTVSDSLALEVFNVHKNAVDTVDFTRRGSSPLPTGSPAIDVLGYSLQILRDICAWESSSSEIRLPVDSLLQTGLVKRLLKYLRELEPPSTIRKSMARGQADQQLALANGKVCPYIGYRRDLVAIIANCLHGRKQVQDEVRKLDGIMLLLQQCVLDEENPYLREWGLLAVKNMLEGNEENQKQVSELELQEPVITPEIASIGLKVEIDKETGRPKLVNTP
jgi:ataxin-10